MCVVSPSGDSQGVTVRTCLVVEEAAVLGGGIEVCLKGSPCAQKESIAPLVLNFIEDDKAF